MPVSALRLVPLLLGIGGIALVPLTAQDEAAGPGVDPAEIGELPAAAAPEVQGPGDGNALEAGAEAASGRPEVRGVGSAEAARLGGGGLPQPVTADHFSAIREQSPFLRTLNLAETYSLRGVAEIGGSPVATLYNRETKKTVTVAKGQSNEAGVTLIEVVPAKDLVGVGVKVSFGGEVVELKYDNQQLSPTATGSASVNGGKGGDGKGDGKRRGPSKEDMERYNSLTEEQKNKFREYARQTMQKYPNMSREERFNLIRGALTRLSDGRDVNVDQPSSTGGGGNR